MIDLAGVRITLTFPKDVDEVKRVLMSIFGDVRQRFWGLNESGQAVECGEEKGRFIGYRATHFLVKWKEPPSEYRLKTNEDHLGSTVEIQVTSIIMSAWQEAQHDLVYKQLNGAPSEDERQLLDMINGLAHAGEVALTQLQNCLKRRLEDGSRAFADEYEVRTWLKDQVPDLLKFKWQNKGVYMQRLTTLFEVLQIFDLKTPENLREALKTPFETDKAPNELSAMFQEKLATESDAEEWEHTFRNDPTDWATLRICTYRFQESLQKDSKGPKSPPPIPAKKSSIFRRDALSKDQPSSIYDAQPLDAGRYRYHYETNLGFIYEGWSMSKRKQTRLKAFFIVNTINFALSEPQRVVYFQGLVAETLTCDRAPDSMIRSLAAVLTSKPDGNMKEEDISNTNRIWDGLLWTTVKFRSMVLRVGLALSVSGVVIMPALAYPEFIDVNARRPTIWPGSLPYGLRNLWGDGDKSRRTVGNRRVLMEERANIFGENCDRRGLVSGRRSIRSFIFSAT
ncbi:hypothetical protein BU16DRAFT_594609 [Lophium mytilinum]|uniref:RelA/SpoT domain-containing protein n=1 Tax=Lophium mytilinum TaxID=390894 RepID=A0A6A6QGP5_9PEZI|nr:hypothetical protein BU16DRAFT_594609 [Lophium mytilinum]